jgi:copper resistance protein D
MHLLAEFFEVFLQGADFLALALAVGGVLFALAVLRPWQPLIPITRKALGQSTRLILVGSGGLILAQVWRLGLQFVVLADGNPGMFIPFLATVFVQIELLRIVAAIGVAAAAWFWVGRQPTSLLGWLVLVGISAGLVLAGAWLMHGASRIDKGASP